jgi:hypothetical protein
LGLLGRPLPVNAVPASDDASWITGQMLNVCGGLTVHDGNDFERLARLVFGDAAIDDLGF